jgi:hypothetical protein
MIINMLVGFLNGMIWALLWRWRPVRKMLEETLVSEFCDKLLIN